MSKKLPNNQYEDRFYPCCGSGGNDNYFTTLNLGLAASLASLNYEIVDLDKENSHKVRFIFPRSSRLEQAVKDYFSGKLAVNAKSMFENIKKMLRNRIYSSL